MTKLYNICKINSKAKALNVVSLINKILKLCIAVFIFFFYINLKAGGTLVRKPSFSKEYRREVTTVSRFKARVINNSPFYATD